MDTEEVKRGRGRGRGTRARGRGRGRGRGRNKKTDDNGSALDTAYEIGTAIIATAAGPPLLEESAIEQTGLDLDKENEMEVTTEEQTMPAEELTQQQQQVAPVLPQTIDMEADISQLEAPTFTTLSRGPPEPMLRLKWNHKVSLIGEKVLNPMIHCCGQCEKPILVYGRMIPCKHVFCLKCARAEPIKSCPRCNDKVLRVEQSGLGTVFMCTHGGSRYGSTGCRRTYLSQRDLQAHINHRHVTQPPPQATLSTGTESKLSEMPSLDLHKTAQRKLSESSVATSALLQPRSARGSVSGIGSIPPPGSAAAVAAQNAHTHSTLTQANLARINNANAQDCHQGKASLHQSLKKSGHQHSETVADASYYSSVLNSFGSADSASGGGAGSTGVAGSNVAVGNSTQVSVGYETKTSNAPSSTSSAWPQTQYYR